MMSPLPPLEGHAWIVPCEQVCAKSMDVVTASRQTTNTMPMNFCAFLLF
jgi:hypothetical protein